MTKKVSLQEFFFIVLKTFYIFKPIDSTFPSTLLRRGLPYKQPYFSLSPLPLHQSLSLYKPPLFFPSHFTSTPPPAALSLSL